MNEFKGTVRIVGAGLLGTSIGLALTKHGADVIITSRSQSSADLAISYGAGRAASSEDKPEVVIVCVPPQLTAAIVAEELKNFPSATVTDVASIKAAILEELISMSAPIERYVGSHPMAGRERGGAISGRADLFVGRPWVITTHEKSDSSRIKAIEILAKSLEAAPVIMDTSDHDRAVALVSHVPQIISSLLATRLIEGAAPDIALAGQGLRDTTRIAASDPELWLQILNGNSKEVMPVLKKFEQDLAALIKSIESTPAEQADKKILEVLESGNRGVERIPG
ncbi:MAG: prephenate dehydrogenase, partial [Rhodoluna sp.]